MSEVYRLGGVERGVGGSGEEPSVCFQILQDLGYTVDQCSVANFGGDLAGT